MGALEQWEIPLIKAMFARGGYKDQDIQAYFTRPTHTVNHRAFGEIRRGEKHKTIKAANEDELNAFLGAWPNLDPETGLNQRGDELLIKAREAMIAAVHTYNGAGITFRTELFIVTSIIAWTYLMHAWFKHKKIPYSYPEKTKQGETKLWELGRCLEHQLCPVSPHVINNLKGILKIRHAVEHRATHQIDGYTYSYLQQCCLNFNDALKNLFGHQYSLEKRLTLALQFASFQYDQRTILKQASDLPPHLLTAITAFEDNLSDEEFNNPAYQCTVHFVRIHKNRASGADQVRIRPLLAEWNRRAVYRHLIGQT